MPEVTEDFIRASVASAKPYSLVVLKRGPNFDTTAHLQMEHLKHIFALRQAGQQVLTCPVMDPESEIVGIALMPLGKDEAAALTAADPGVQAGRLTYEILGCMAMPGDGVR